MTLRDRAIEFLFQRVWTSARYWYVQLCAWCLTFFFGKVDDAWLLTSDFGTWLGHDIHNDDEQTLINRLGEADIVLVWIQGVGFRSHLGRLYYPTFVRLIDELAKKNIKCTMLMAKYALKPYPAPLDDLVKLQTWLHQSLQVPGSKVVWGADDAGAAIALDTLYRRDLPTEQQPASLMLVSPYIGMESGGKSWQDNLTEDRLTDKDVEAMESRYAPGLRDDSYKEDEPLAYLHNTADMSRFSSLRILLHMGEQQVLLEDAPWFKEKLESGGNTKVQLVTTPGRHLDALLLGKSSDIGHWVDFLAAK
ncbi:hypothetical protein DM01DRAFT_1336403 [Hesseltinella vesiculosa]|uniref:Alpha/beta hydrolase fold-3 domain-containing protein n=1 Tax=Hesseltinella vesiculosa TaxID=101127 RepID=A0A1X2GGG6_9FUNG|nr:hypothetical protein DM01DRAFT_1336403 [Hesseltinella vesiculosa]